MTRDGIRRRIAVAILGLHLAFLLYVTWGLRFRPPRDGLWNLTPLKNVLPYFRKGGWEFTVNILGNLGVFMPIGFLLPWFLDRPLTWRSVVLASMGLSIVIEFGQWLTGARVADIDDVLLNTIGGALGFALHRLIAAPGRNSGPRTRISAPSKDRSS